MINDICIRVYKHLKLHKKRGKYPAIKNSKTKHSSEKKLNEARRQTKQKWKAEERVGAAIYRPRRG